MRLITRLLLISVSAFLCVSACSAPREREYPLKGQIVAVDKRAYQLRVKHEDIRGLMPGMVMSFDVSDRTEIEQRKAGELITATLVVRDSGSRLKDIVVVGTAPLDPAAARAAAPALEVGDAVPEGDFVDQDGRRRHLSEWRGSAVLLTFIYTRCPLPDFCPRIERNFADLQKVLAADAHLRDTVRLVTVSFDPKHDTPEVLKEHAQAIGARRPTWTFLTGEVSSIERFAAGFGVTIVRNPTDERDITHNLRTVLIGPDGRIARVFTGSDWTTADALAALKQTRAGLS